MSATETPKVYYKGKLTGHKGWVTCLATSIDNNVLISGSRDQKLFVWKLSREQTNFGEPKKSLEGHSHFVSDVAVSSDGLYALSSSWDKTLRLWEIKTGRTTKTFTSENGHKDDVLSVAFSHDNRQIVSSGRDRAIKLWNTLGECKWESTQKGHQDWVSCVAFSPDPTNAVIVSAGWDRIVKVWNLKTGTVQSNLIGHTGYINTVTVSPDGSLCASGGKDGTAMLWDLKQGKHLYSLEAGDNINALVFSPNRYWLCAATPSCIKIWDLQSKKNHRRIGTRIQTKCKRSKTRMSMFGLVQRRISSILWLH
mmetsp:Transcript_3144/g.4645  ORF Transcript_3144/g.4645 Transcript_3144/m.4645 type:complete len:309 (+) Transcript_3144:62-988(+)